MNWSPSLQHYGPILVLEVGRVLCCRLLPSVFNHSHFKPQRFDEVIKLGFIISDRRDRGDMFENFMEIYHGYV